MALLLCKGWENFLWLLSLPPGPHAAPLAFWGAVVLDSHQPWAFRGFNPRVFGGVSRFLLRSRPLPLAGSPFLCVSHHTLLAPSSLDNTAASGQSHSPEMNPTGFPAAFPPPLTWSPEGLSPQPSSGGLVPLLAGAMLKMSSAPTPPQCAHLGPGVGVLWVHCWGRGRVLGPICLYCFISKPVRQSSFL